MGEGRGEGEKGLGRIGAVGGHVHCGKHMTRRERPIAGRPNLRRRLINGVLYGQEAKFAHLVRVHLIIVGCRDKEREKWSNNLKAHVKLPKQLEPMARKGSSHEKSMTGASTTISTVR